jgi:hypothetical protein
MTDTPPAVPPTVPPAAIPAASPAISRAEPGVAPSVSPEASAQPTRQAPPRWRLPLLTGIAGFVLGILVVLAVIGLISLASTLVKNSAGQTSSAAAKAKFEKAIDNCALNQSEVLNIGNGGRKLTILSAGTAGANGLSSDSVVCVLSGLDAPDAVTNAIASGSDSSQSLQATWDGLTAVWVTNVDGAVAVTIVATPTTTG